MPIDLPILITAYKRSENLGRIFEICKEAGVTRIYFAVDGPATLVDKPAVEKVKILIRNFTADDVVKVVSYFAPKNAGCSAAVINACDWFFKKEKFGAIIEDDCIPSLEFIEFMREAMPLIEKNDRIWLACGTQFFPEILTGTSWALSKYPMHWGWGTTAAAWKESRVQLELNPPKFRKYLKSLRSAELVYWFAGERRGYYGFTDVWDTIYTSNMIRLSRLAIVPSTNLVTNIGDDTFATNTTGNQKYTNFPTMRYEKSLMTPVRNYKYDQVVKKNYFKISTRHYLTTLVTLIIDIVKPNRKILSTLSSRLTSSKFIH